MSTFENNVTNLDIIHEVEKTSDNHIEANTVFTVGTSNADFSSLSAAFNYLINKWSNGIVSVELTSDLVINDIISWTTFKYNIPLLVIEGKNHNITFNYSDEEYLPYLRIYGNNYIQFNSINFIGGTNSTNHILFGAYAAHNVILVKCSFDNAYAGVIAYQDANIFTEECKFYQLQVGIQAQQSGTVLGRANTYGMNGKRCYTCCNVYLNGIVRDSQQNIINYHEICPTGKLNQVSSSGIIIVSN